MLWWESWRDLLLDATITVAVTWVNVLYVADTSWGNSGLSVRSMAIVVGLTLIVRRRYPVAVAVATLALAPIPSFTPRAALPIALYSAARHGRSRGALVVVSGAAFLAVAVGRVWFMRSDGSLVLWEPETYVELGLVVVPVLFGLYITARRTVMENLKDRAERLERERHLLAEQARSEERARIAQEMHDVVAHRVSLMVVHAGALEIDPDQSERAAQAGQMIGQIGRQALAELRQVLGVLRLSDKEDCPVPLSPQPSLEDLTKLLQQSRDTGIPVALRISGERHPLGGTAERTAYRLVQEALTNVHKHAGHATTVVHLHYLPGGLRVTVENDAPSTRPLLDLPSGGHGLTGLRERVSVLGGTFLAAEGPAGGFQVSAWIPAVKGAA
ncbi:sensor histidine kinase [Streptomyces inhibens]|uniref:sensor histidine kinase n=1 Tax=Streptomyces inhibens TaxID=2293571 RepID=UPI0015F29486|nr:histidine kinase [Streptomyces inhibens]